LHFQLATDRLAEALVKSEHQNYRQAVEEILVTVGVRKAEAAIAAAQKLRTEIAQSEMAAKEARP
jgi:hypothetical protein